MIVARARILAAWPERHCEIVAEGVYHNHHSFLKGSWVPASLMLPVCMLIRSKTFIMRKDATIRLIVKHGSRKEESTCKEVDAYEMHSTVISVSARAYT